MSVDKMVISGWTPGSQRSFPASMTARFPEIQQLKENTTADTHQQCCRAQKDVPHECLADLPGQKSAPVTQVMWEVEGVEDFIKMQDMTVKRYEMVFLPTPTDVVQLRMQINHPLHCKSEKHTHKSFLNTFQFKLA